MSSLDEARAKIEARRAQQATGGSNDLWFRKDDLVLCHFFCTGGDNDPYFDTYVAHEEPAKGQGQFPTLLYCPVESGHDGNYDCRGCKEGLKTKDRMIMWFWVYDILHATLRQGEQLPQTMYNNKPYFQREVNGPRLWDTSAWRESCLDDIIMLGGQLGNLQNSMMTLMATGDGMQRRYKIYLMPNTGTLDLETVMPAANDVIKSVIEVLRERLVQVPVVANPNGNSQPTPMPAGSSPIAPYTPPGGSGDVQPYVPPGAAATGSVTVPAKPIATGKKPAGKNQF